MKKLAIILLSVFLSFSCESKEYDKPGEPEPEAPKETEPRTILPKADKKVVKVIAVYEDPKVNDNQYLHDVGVTPGYSFKWEDPRELCREYKKFFEEQSGGVIEYQIVDEIEADVFWTHFWGDQTKTTWTKEQVIQYMREPAWSSIRNDEQQYHPNYDGRSNYKYKEMVEYYGFDKMRDNNEVHEIWVWSYPLGGMWESTFSGKGAFWLNSPVMNPTTSNEKLLIVMGLNYERDLACAVESYGHRIESIMREVYGRWNPGGPLPPNPNMWELFTAYSGISGGKTYVGNIHFPPNGRHDYDWGNTANVKSYHNEWKYYPDIRLEDSETVNCSKWGCSHLGYFKFWWSHLPNFKGKHEGKLNNWWHYIVDYNEAKELEMAE